MLYLCIAGAQVRKGQLVQFDVYSSKLAVLPTGQRGDPLKIVMYNIFPVTATKNGKAGLREYFFLLVGVSSAISVKSNQRPALCTEIRRVRAPGSRTDSRVSRNTEKRSLHNLCIPVPKY